MKRVLVFFLGAVMLVSLSLVVSCQKKEETGISEEKPAAGYGEQAVEHLEKAAGYGEQAVEEATEKAAGH